MIFEITKFVMRSKGWECIFIEEAGGPFLMVRSTMMFSVSRTEIRGFSFELVIDGSSFGSKI